MAKQVKVLATRTCSTKEGREIIAWKLAGQLAWKTEPWSRNERDADSRRWKERADS